MDQKENLQTNCVIQQQCDIIISKVSHDSSHLSLWPKKVLEEFLNPRTSFPTIFTNIHLHHLSGKCLRSFSKQRTSSRLARAPQWVCRAPLWACPTLLWGCSPAPQPRPTPSRAFIQVRELKNEKSLMGDQFYPSPSKVPFLIIYANSEVKATKHDQYWFQLLTNVF